MDFTVNETEFHLNEKFNADKIGSARLNKMGFFAKLFTAPFSDYQIYWTKNCRFSLLSDSFSLSPNLNSNEILGLWGTSTYFYYLDRKLEKVIFQAIHNQNVALAVERKVGELLNDEYGNPTNIQEEGKTWNSNDNRFRIQVKRAKNNAYIILESPTKK